MSIARAAGATALVLAAACGASPSSDPTSSTAPPPVVAVAATAVTGIEVVAGDRSAVVEPGRWSRLVPLVTARRLDAVEPLASYGLDPPVARLTYRLVDGEELTVHLGTTTFDDVGRYALRPRSGELVVVLAADVEPALELVTEAGSGQGS